MSSSTPETVSVLARRVKVSDDALSVDLSDGRTISVPLLWFPRLMNGTAAERKSWRFIGGGQGIHWPKLDEDISIAGLLAGRMSMESQPSIKKWLDSRSKKRPRRKPKD